MSVQSGSVGRTKEALDALEALTRAFMYSGDPYVEDAALLEARELLAQHGRCLPKAAAANAAEEPDWPYGGTPFGV